MKTLQKFISDFFTNWWLFIIFIMLSLLFIYLFDKTPANDKTPIKEGMNNVKGRGYCDVQSEYILPKIHNNFITDAEANYILEKATPEFNNSNVLTGLNTGIRKSQTAWLPQSDPVISKIIGRVCDLTNIPFENAEKMQVVKYEPDGFYREHHDAACDDYQECIDFEKKGGQRKITMLIYLSDNFEGGETRFPNLNQDYKPPRCSGLLFHPLEKKGGKCHPYALHAGMPVTSGEKYIANIWLREKPYIN